LLCLARSCSKIIMLNLAKSCKIPPLARSYQVHLQEWILGRLHGKYGNEMGPNTCVRWLKGGEKNQKITVVFFIFEAFSRE
jgi:hypothetical protein